MQTLPTHNFPNVPVSEIVLEAVSVPKVAFVATSSLVTIFSTKPPTFLASSLVAWAAAWAVSAALTN